MIYAQPLFDITNNKITNLTKNTKQGIRKAFYFIGKDLKKESVRLINQKPKSGRFYIINVGIGGKALKSPRIHQASAPNEAPAVITGKLRKSISFNVHNFNQLEFGSNVEYGKYLELGTVKMKPRPYLKPSILNKNKNSILYIGNNIVKLIK